MRIILIVFIFVGIQLYAQDYQSQKDSLDPAFWIDKAAVEQSFIQQETANNIKREKLNKVFLYSQKALKLDRSSVYKAVIYNQLSNIATLYVLTGVNFFNNGEYQKALEMFDKNITILGRDYLDKVNPMVFLSAAVTAEKLKDYDKAQYYYQEKLKLTPTDETAFIGLAQAYKKNKQNKRYVSLMKKGLLFFSKDTLVFYGELLNYYIEQSSWDTALYYTNLIIKKDSLNDKIYYMRGFIYQEKNKIKEANNNYKKAYYYNKNNTDALYNLSVNLYNECSDLLHKKRDKSEDKILKTKLEVLKKYLSILKDQEPNNVQIDAMIKNVNDQTK